MSQPDWVTKLEAEPCMCKPCSSCSGKGTVYWLLGKYCGPHHPCDDLADPEPCEWCHNGVEELCDRCAALEDFDICGIAAALTTRFKERNFDL